MSTAKAARFRPPIEILMDAPEDVNPAVRLAWQLQEAHIRGAVGLEDLIPLADTIDKAIEAGQELTQVTDDIMRQLAFCESQPSNVVPTGF